MGSWGLGFSFFIDQSDLYYLYHFSRVKKEKKKGTYSVWSFSFHTMLYYLDHFSNQRVKKEGLNLCMVFQFSYNVVALS